MNGADEPSATVLAGMHVLVPRPEGAAEGLIDRLRACGADVLHVPAIRTTDPPAYGALDVALARLSTYDWIVFTSANGVQFTMQRLAALRIPPVEGRRMPKVAAIGIGTERALARYGITTTLVPPEAIAESLRDALVQAGVGVGTRVLLPQPLEGRDVLATGLRAAGASVDIVPAYQTVTNTEGGAAIGRWLAGPGTKVALVTSPSTARGLLAMLGGDRERFACIPLVCIGPVTAAAVTELGASPALVAPEHTNDGLIAALIAYTRQMKGATAA